MKTSSVALFLALSAGYLGAASAQSVNDNQPRDTDATITSNHDPDAEPDNSSRTAVKR